MSAAPQQAISSDSHLPALDGLRGVAILLVMLYHQTVMSVQTAFDEIFVKLPLVGWSGVDLFFVLSGFLITGILVDARGGKHYFRNFYARRILRIFPLYYALVFFSLVVLPAIPHPWAANFSRISGDEIWYWLFLSNFSIANNDAFRHAILDISWSLAIEEQFYLIWPVIVLLCSRRGLLAVCAALIVGALGTRIVLLMIDTSPIAIYVLPFTRIDALCIGAAIAILAREPHGLTAIVRYAPPTLLGSGVALLALSLIQGGLSWEQPATQLIGYTLLAVFFGACLARTLTLPSTAWASRALCASWLRTLGRYSYALYLFHLPVRGVLRDTVFGPERFPTILSSQIPGQILFYLAATGATLALAWLSWHLYEQPFLRLKRFFPIEPGMQAARRTRTAHEIQPLDRTS